jgi:hypothetical protein
MTEPATTALTCRACGRSPAQEFTIRRHVGMLIMQKFVKFRGPLCRDHAQQLSKEFLNRTLVQGWWGLISFFVNFFVIATDLAAMSKANKMPPPVTVPGSEPTETAPAEGWAAP